MQSVIDYESGYMKELYRLYCLHHNMHYEYDDYKNIVKYIPDIKSMKIKLLKIDKKIRGYILFNRVSPFSHDSRAQVQEIFIEKVYNTSSNYSILLNSINKGFFLKKHKYAQIYLDCIKKNYELIYKLDLKIEKKIYDMKILLNSIRKIGHSKSIGFINFKKGVDESKRASIQNAIFKDTKGHKDCTVEDILLEEEQEYFIEDGCIFLNYNNQTAGYSQIILENYPEIRPYIVNFGILNEFRGLGLSKPLLYYTLNIIKSKGFKEAFITVDASNKKAYNLYKKCGFIRVGTLGCYLYKYR